MRGVRLTSIRHFIYALLALVLVACAAEVGMRVYSVSCVVSETPDESDSLTSPSWVRHHQLTPLSTTVVQSTVDGQSIEIRTNSFGLRGPEPKPPQDATHRRILLLGDDLVFCGETPFGVCYSQHLQQLLSASPAANYEVINGATPGYCPLLSYLHYRHELAGLQPDLVVLHVNWSDSIDDPEYRRHTQIDSELGPLACAHPDLSPSRQSNPARIVCRDFRLLQWLSQRAGRFLNSPSGTIRSESESARRTDWKTTLQQTMSAVTQLHQELNRASVPFVVVVTPLPDSNGSNDSRDRTQELIAAHLRQQGLNVYQTGQALRAHVRLIRAYDRVACVLTAEGQTMLAGELAEVIKDRENEVAGVAPATAARTFSHD